MRSSTLLALAASISASAAGSIQGFNYGSTKSDGTFHFQSDFEALFATAKKVTNGFNSARLYTMIQGGSSTNEPISAIPAAIAQDTTLLLGLWASGGEGPFQAEITALKSAIDQYGTKFTDLVVGISVGSEDLYRISPTGIAAKSGYGANPDELVKYIKQLRAAIADTPLSKATIGHVDTWTAWVNSSNSAVAEACDWIGMDAYPYFQNSMSNSIEDGASLFDDALSATQAAVGGKEIWITETGWPVSGKTENLAVPNKQNAKAYWDAVGCPNFGKMNIYWYTLQDSDPVTPNPSFGVVGSKLSNTPLYDLSCDNVSAPHSSTAASSAVTASESSPAKETGAAGSTPTGSGSPTGGATGGNGSSATGTGSGSGPGTGTGPSSTFSPVPTTNGAAAAMFVAGPAGVLAAAAAFMAVL